MCLYEGMILEAHIQVLQLSGLFHAPHRQERKLSHCCDVNEHYVHVSEVIAAASQGQFGDDRTLKVNNTIPLLSCY
jgi:hypothetical protein